MKFGQVFGALVEVDDRNSTGRILVTLDTRLQVSTVRDERVVLRKPPEGQSLVEWNCDQYTQETIGTSLAEEGWEVFGQPVSEEQSDATGSQTATYLVRLL